MPPPDIVAAAALDSPPKASWGGNWVVRIAADTSRKPPSDVAELSSWADLDVKSDASAPVVARVVGRLNYDAWARNWEGAALRAAASVELREATVTARFPELVIVAGNQVLRWGALDWLSPNDVINPIDFSHGGVSAFEVPLIPVPALRATFTRGSLSLEGVYVPFFFQHRLYVTGSDWALSHVDPQLAALDHAVSRVVPLSNQERAQDLLAGVDRPDEGPANGSVGLRVGLHFPMLDLHLNEWFGWNRAPSVSWNPAALSALAALDAQPGVSPSDATLAAIGEAFASGEPWVKFAYRRRLVLGGDAVLALDPFLLKAELAYSPKEVFYTRGFEATTTAALTGAAAVEYQWQSLVDISVEISGRALTRTAPEGRQYLFTEQNQAVLAGFARVVLIDRKLWVEARGEYQFGQKDHLALAQLTYRFSGANEFGIGGLTLGGPLYSLGGSFSGNDELFGLYRFSF